MNAPSNSLTGLQSLRPLVWMQAACLDWLVIGVAIGAACAVDSVYSYIAAILVVGNRQHALTILGHEAAHRRVTRNLILNDMLGNVLCFWCVGLSLYGYRKLHFDHHKFLKTVDDPEKPLLDLSFFSLPISAKKFAIQTMKDLLGLGLRDLAFVASRIQSKNAIDNALPVLWLGGLGGIFVLQGYWQVPAVWMAAIVTSQFAFTRLRTWTEHVGVFGTHKFHAGVISRLLIYPHNCWLHFEHHEHPLVPFYNLRQARTTLETETISLPELYKRIWLFKEHNFKNR